MNARNVDEWRAKYGEGLREAGGVFSCPVSAVGEIAGGNARPAEPLADAVPPAIAYATKMRPDLEAIAPDRIRQLPVDPERLYPVPFFVPWINGKPEFRAADSRTKVKCLAQKLCWVCGQRLGQIYCFPIGPMCALNRISAEPPSHYDCSVFSVKACPFLSKPQMVRRENDLPAARGDAPGFMIERNPGVTLLWITREFTRMLVPGGSLFQIGEPESLEWYKEGRPATRAEILYSIITGLPTLFAADAARPEVAKKAVEAIAKRFVELEKVLPK